ncbi:MAG TPA: GNAT family N-acetyltransferase [Chitinophagaceae bacterium]|nr:GNAT family N-acetyltransferase [Chitinophagaceae bacterium]
MNPVYECTRGPYLLSTDKGKLDLEVIHGFLSLQAYWCLEIPRETVARAMEHSLCYGIYLEGHQIGFCRVVTDMAIFAHLADVFILEPHRGKGLAAWMVRCAVAHPAMQGLRRWTLATRDAHQVYRRAGFQSLDHPERWMQIHLPDPYSKKAAPEPKP